MRIAIVVVLTAVVVVGLLLFAGRSDTPAEAVAHVVSAVLVGGIGAIGLSTFIALPRLRTARILRRRLPQATVFVASNQYDVLRELAELPPLDPANGEPLGDFVTVSIDGDGLTVWSAGGEPQALRRIDAADIHSVEPDYVEAHLGLTATLHVQALINGALTSLR
ncbi:hypothetical protein Q0F99_10380 [Rathayibacter oskolensis]|uniref:hypothetical protein n=1 Tax=Rathayibacter oskolensis TaxID=1891671 RepID=UPI00265D6F8F|nr:hypothetical protein [Rathayibacter oskolensis]WKK70306.1 hypothetical protein Q0F99_10380 [Rathayibacter oskolensis]